MEASVTLKEAKCVGCEGRLCGSCGCHLQAEEGSVCVGCVADEAFTAGLITEKVFRATAGERDRLETDASACPECGGGLPCAEVCSDCGVAEMQDRLRHERSHGPGVF